MTTLIEYKNGNASVRLYEDGTRILEYEQSLELDQPLNLDIRLFNKCSNGYNPKTGKAICAWCHEGQLTEGSEACYSSLKEKLEELSPGIELAIGANEISPGFIDFIHWCNEKRFIVNLTVNQLHLIKFNTILRKLIEQDLIKGLGVSYRKDYQLRVDSYILNYPNTILHCILGIDTIDEVLNSPFNKVILLGYKSFGAGEKYYSLFSSSIDKNIRQWQMYIPKLFGNKILSFDNLAIQQLQIQRFFSQTNWNIFYQGEESFYINAVDGYFAPSSRTKEGIVDWNSTTIKQYYKKLRA